MRDDATAEERHRYVIIGGGPGGLALSYFLGRAGADYVTLEREASPGSFFRRFPRHRRLISLNKVNVSSNDPETRLRWDWNSLLNDREDLLFPRYSTEYFPHADDMVRYLADFQRQHALNVQFGVTVDRVAKVDGEFHVRAGGRLFRATCLIVATGWAEPYVPDIPGIELAVGYEDMPLDGERFQGQRVLVIGKGNSAFETANQLLGHAAMVHLASPSPVRLSWNTKHPGDVRAQHAGAFLDSYQLKTLHSVLDCVIERIWREGDCCKVLVTYTHAHGEQALLEYDAILRCTGFRMDTSIFDESCRPELVPSGRIPQVREDWQSANVDGMYFAGTLMQARDFKRASSAFIDGFRYNLRTLARLLNERYEGVELACRVVAADPDRVTETVLERLNGSSALWTQFEYLADVMIVEEASGQILHFEDLPEDYAVIRFGTCPHYYTVTLRWGREAYPDVFAIERHPEPERAAESAFIHPVVRRWQGRDLVAEQHLLEDLMAEWRSPQRHVEPLRRFFRSQLVAR